MEGWKERNYVIIISKYKKKILKHISLIVCICVYVYVYMYVCMWEVMRQEEVQVRCELEGAAFLLYHTGQRDSLRL